MSYADARSQLVTVLLGVSVTTPVAASIVRVYEAPPEAVQDWPAAILYGSAGTRTPAMGLVAPDEVHTERVRIVHLSEDIETALRTLFSLRDAAAAAVLTSSAIAQYAQVERVEWAEPVGVEIGRRTFLALDLRVVMHVR